MTEIRRSAECGSSPKNAKAEAIALALMGAGPADAVLADGGLAEAASWDRPGGSVAGRVAILAAAEGQRADLIRIEQVVTHGRAGSVSGRVTRGTETRLFCHVIRFTSAAATQVAQIVSFEHPEAPEMVEPIPLGEPRRPDEEHHFPCPQCGADLRFDAAGGQMTCDHCGYAEAIEGHGGQGRIEAIRELDFRTALDARLPEAEMEALRTASCPNCGAHVDFDGAVHATECPFCATPVVADTGQHRQIKPKGLLPFGFEEREAHKAMSDWLGRLWFAPNGLREYARKGRKMTGIYVPYWTFDADTRSSYRGERGTIYYVTKTVMRDGKPTQVREQRIRWNPKSGRVARFFDDVLVLASKSLPKRYTDALEPWDLAALEPYRPEYLAGYRAEGYTVALEEGYDQARAHMDAVILRDVKFDIGGDRQRVHDIQTTVSDVTFKHILLPVWMAAYKYRGKTYRFVVNGQTGKVQGERPWSAWKIAFAVVLGLIVAGVIGYFAAQQQ